ncbi:BTB/POZ domain protein [Penicillium concentricum]|uniref:BTB/POZ domain protein n=1 Tax=Penicillium concentricum TaxID=293559 RepID=A0A9W9S4J0_9EURO|nr:BTB/POZ domain protein [Penicillium concentricum]KAJ5371881.1 BTB/POZ domain protein [Penicillium concentricum]
MCNANFLEGKTGKISLPDDDPEAIYMMVQHLYGQSYKDTRLGLKDYGEGRALLNLNVYASADKYNIPSLEECAKEEFKDWAWRSQCTESWGHVVEEAWKGNEFSGLHLIIEKQIAEDIDPMLKDDWLPFIDKGMKLGRLSAAFLRHIVEKKNGIFYALRDTEKGYERDIIDLKKKIKGYRYTLEQLGKEMKSDAYDSDESIEF